MKRVRIGMGLMVSVLGVGAFVWAQGASSGQVEPTAGSWKTWVIPSGSSLR